METPHSLDSHGVAARLGGGHFLENLQDALSRVTEEVLATGKQGQVTVTFKITKPNAAEPLITVNESIGTKLPASEPHGSMLYVDGGKFFARDPRQSVMEFREVEPPDTSDRSVDEETGEVREATE